MIEKIVVCISCKENNFSRFYTFWECRSCGQQYPCVSGIPKLLIEKNIGKPDKRLRDEMYNGLLGRFYNLLMPFLSLPARPVNISLTLWALYFLVIFIFGFLLSYIFQWVTGGRLEDPFWVNGLIVGTLTIYIVFLAKYPYLRNLILLAVPVKFSLALRRFVPKKSFREVHGNFQAYYQDAQGPLRILDVATGSCNSLYRHGWMDLDADYVGIDLSEQMLLRGAEFMTAKGIRIDFALADSHEIPFESESFDIVTCYGAVNGFADIKKALNEMLRVTKRGGRILFLDEQLYKDASLLERLYFNSVLSSHDTVKECPADLLPHNVDEVEIHQVYQFYYICTARKI